MIRLLWIVALGGLLTSTCYLALVLAAVVRFRLRARRAVLDHFAPPVSVLKPLHGAEPDLELHLESFFNQNYPAYEVLFCARHADDAGLAIARRVAERYPQIPVQFVTSGEPPWPNARCYSQELMRKAARHDLLAISDSDVKVTPEYLRQITRPFREERVGLVTCMYRGVPHGGPWSLLEALGMSVEMTSGVLVAWMLEGMRFALGPTMVVRNRCMDELGGFEEIGHYLADDFVLGSMVAARGHEVVLSTHAIEHHVLNSAFGASMAHQSRWMQSTRFSRPMGHLGTVLTFAVPFGLLAGVAGVLSGHLALGFAALAWSLITRMLQSVLVGGLVVRDRRSVEYAWLYPLRDFMGFLFWAASYTSNTVRWREDRFELQPRGYMRRCARIESAAAGSLAASGEGAETQA